MINFEDYYKAERLSQLDRENLIIHENMETLATLLPRQNKDLSDEFVDLAYKVNKLIKYDLPNVSLLERSTTRMSFLLKRTGERDTPTITEQIEDLKSTGDDFIASISHVNLMEDYYTETMGKRSKLLYFLFRACNIIALFVAGYLMRILDNSWFAFPFVIAALLATFLFIIDSVGLVFDFHVKRKKFKVQRISEFHNTINGFYFYSTMEYPVILLNPLVFILIKLGKRDLENVFSTVLHSNKIINVNTYFKAPEKIQKQINELSKYELSESYAIKLNELINQIYQEGISSSERNTLHEHLNCFNECLSLLNEK